MKKFFYLAVISIFLTSCASSTTVENNVNLTNSNFSPVSQNPHPNTNVENQTASNTGKPQDLSTSIGNALSAEKKKEIAVNAAPIQAKPLVNTAPDNSEISSTMNNQGIPIEIRTFKNNPMLAKVEKVFTDLKNPQIKVYLKNGKVVDLPSGKISNSSTASANEILTAVGVISKTASEKKETKDAIEKREQ